MNRFLQSPLRVLHGISYWVIEDPKSIHDYVNRNLRREWEMDARKTGKHVEEDLWLKTLSTRRWSLEMMRMNHIRLDPTIMNLRSDTKKYDFQTELAKRRAELRRSLEYGSVIWPLVVDEGMILRDGYCRYTTLAEIGVTETYCYTCEAPTQRGTGGP